MAPGNGQTRTKVFICYNHEDTDPWLNRLLVHLKPLERDGVIEPWLDKKITTGEEWLEKIKGAIAAAKIGILLVSADFLASDFIRDVELPALLAKAEADGAKIMPVIVKPSRFKETKSISRFQAVNAEDEPLIGMSEVESEAVFVKLTKDIEAVLNSVAGDDGKTPTLWNVPHPRNTFFTGREKELKLLRRALTSGKKAALAQPQAISGLGGIGKTQTAVEYAYKYRDEYNATFWVKAETSDDLASGFAEIAALLGLPEAQEAEQSVAAEAVKRWLEANDSWLLVLDNADTPAIVKDFLPTEPKGHVLLTSRAQVFDMLGIGKPVELDDMEPKDGLEFLLRRTDREETSEEEKKSAAELAEELGYLPLALEQAGAYMLAHRARFDGYLKSYRKLRLKLLEETPPVAGGYRESVAKTWAMNFDYVEKECGAAADVLRFSAFVSPDDIPLELMAKGGSKLSPEVAKALAGVEGNPVRLDELLEPLTRYSLINRDVDSNTYSVHRMVQEVLKTDLKDEQCREWAERTVLAVNKALPKIEFEDWPLCERLLPHARAAARLIKEYDVVTGEAGRLLSQTGYYLTQRAKYAEAEPLYKRAITIDERVHGLEDTEVATGLNNLAALYRTQGKYAEAEPLHERSLAIREKALGPEHTDVAQSLNNLATLYYDQGKYAEAEPLCERSLAIYEKALGPSHPYVAQSLNNLATLYCDIGKYAEAEPLFERAIAIREKVLGPEHPDMAGSLNNLAALRHTQQKYAEAEPLLERSLVIVEKALGMEHPYVAQSLNNLATLYCDIGKYAEAEPLYERSLAIREKALGPEHPYVAASLNNLANLYRVQGREKEAEPLEARAKAIMEKHERENRLGS